MNSPVHGCSGRTLFARGRSSTCNIFVFCCSDDRLLCPSGPGRRSPGHAAWFWLIARAADRPAGCGMAFTSACVGSSTDPALR